MSARSLVLALMASAALGGCSLAPRYERPGLPVGQTWPVAAGTATSTVPGADLAWRERLTAACDPARRGSSG